MDTPPETGLPGGDAPQPPGRRRRPFLSTWFGRALVCGGLAFAPYGWTLLRTENGLRPATPSEPQDDGDEYVGLGLLPHELR
jgi:hypothetical protein